MFHGYISSIGMGVTQVILSHAVLNFMGDNSYFYIAVPAVTTG